MNYNWQQDDWPQFRYDLKEVEANLAAFTEKAGVVTPHFYSHPTSHCVPSLNIGFGDFLRKMACLITTDI